VRAAVPVLFLAVAPLALAACGTMDPRAATPGRTAAPQQQARFFPADEELRQLLQSLVERGQAKGIVLGLLEPDGSRRIISYGEAGSGARPLGPKSVFEIGSINKTFTGAILADMVRRGEVSLNDPVAKYLPPDVRVPSRGGRQITLLDLATHTSGLPRVPTGYKIPDRANPYAHYEAAHLYEFLSSYELERDVGAEPVYSNLGMGLLGHALARAAGAKSFAELVRQRITGPLHLRMTDYGRDGELGAWIVKGHNQKDEEVPYWDVAVLAGAGGLNANVEDMLTYLAANVGAPDTPLEAAMRDAHQPRRKLKTEGWSVGLGWQTRTRDGQTVVNHGGGTAGFETYLGFDPATRAGVVILGNSDGFESRDEVMFQLLRGRSIAQLPESLLAAYPGTYRLRPDFEIAVTLEDGKLYGKPTGQPKARLFPEAPDKFFLMVEEAQLLFNRDERGVVASATLNQDGRSLTGARIG
jgi:serine-type D-Ala-D-Ala carboxypeptidase/endopeptidase